MTIANNSNSGTVNIDSFLLQYKIEGKGLPAIVIGSVNQYPQAFSENLREHLQLIFIDHRAFVAAPKDRENETFELDTILDDIDQIRQALNLDQVIIVGHSGHSYMALEYAKKYPKHVSHVVMIAISPNLSLEHQSAAALYWQDMASDERKAIHNARLQQCSDEVLNQLEPGERFIKEYISKGAKYWYDLETDGSFLWTNVPMNMAIFTHLWRDTFKTIDLTQGLADFNKPVFLALGLYDFAIAPFTAWYPIRDKFKQLDLFVFEKSAHVPQWEEAELFDERLLQWLSKTS
jgi:proline iminopeptidase